VSERWQKAYVAWRKAAERGYGSKTHITDLRRIDARIARLKKSYEAELARAKARAKESPAIRVENNGSVVLVRPLNGAARRWLDENVQAEGWQWFGGALACEPRTVEGLVAGFVGDGGEIR
jgi:hypothetical protein